MRRSLSVVVFVLLLIVGHGANLLISTIMAGVLLFAMGAFKLGTLVRFIPISIVIGFTNGIAVIIALQQVKDFLGLSIEKMPSNFFSQLAAIAEANRCPCRWQQHTNRKCRGPSRTRKRDRWRRQKKSA